MLSACSKSAILAGPAARSGAISALVCSRCWAHFFQSPPPSLGRPGAGFRRQTGRLFATWPTRRAGQDWSIEAIEGIEGVEGVESTVGSNVDSRKARTDEAGSEGHNRSEYDVATHIDDDTNQDSPGGPSSANVQDNNDPPTQDASSPVTPGDGPWYLRIEPPRRPDSHLVVPLPQLPPDPPPILHPFLSYVYDTMGLDDLDVLDLRALDPPHALGPNLVMVMATARSDRHLNVSCRRLLSWLRREHAVYAQAAGIVSPRDIKLKLKRQQRRSRMIRATSGYGGGRGGGGGGEGLGLGGWGGGGPGDHGLSTGWVCVNLGTLGELRAASADRPKLDASGRMSGFGLTRTGTTVVLQAMTEARRKELDLETMWRDMMAENDGMRAFIEADDKPEAPARGLSSIRLRTPVKRYVEHSSSGDKHSRGYSTRASPPHPSASPDSIGRSVELPLEATVTFPFSQLRSPSPPSGAVASFDVLSRYVAAIRNSVTPPSPVTYAEVIHLVLSSSTTASPEQKLSLVERVLAVMSERHLSLLTHDILVPVITALARFNLPADSLTGRPAPHEALLRAQTNLEALQYVAGLPCPSEPHLLALLSAYVVQDSWARFWDTFRLPTRHARGRSPALFHRVYELLAATGSQNTCAEGLREAVPEMLRERNPHIPLTPHLYAAIMGCIDIAEPLARVVFEQERARAGSSMTIGDADGADYDLQNAEKKSRWEFVKMLRTLDQVWTYSVSMRMA